MKKLAIVMIALTLITVVFSGCLTTDNTQLGFSSSDLMVPSTGSMNATTVEPPGTVVPHSGSGRPAILLSWAITPDVYRVYGGVLVLTIQNNDTSDLFIYGFGLKWDGSGQSYYKECNVTLAPLQEKELGLLSFGAPNSTTATYRIVLKVMQQTDIDTWEDYGILSQTDNNKQNITSLGVFRAYDLTVNDVEYYNQVNSNIDVSAVSTIAEGIQSEFPGRYNVLQIAAAYEWVKDNIVYLKEPDGQDHWQTTAETLLLRTGDCEDQAFVLASIIEALGGTARLNIIEDHMFPTVYIGANISNEIKVDQALASFYGMDVGQMHFHYLNDSTGYWLIVDTTGFPYAGGLATLTEPTGTDGSWAFSNTSYLYVVDATGKTTSISQFHLFG